MSKKCAAIQKFPASVDWNNAHVGRQSKGVAVIHITAIKRPLLSKRQPTVTGAANFFWLELQCHESSVFVRHLAAIVNIRRPPSGRLHLSVGHLKRRRVCSTKRPSSFCPANERRPSGPLPANCCTCQSVTVASKSLKIWLELLIFVRLLLELRPEHFNISLLVAHLLAKSWPCRFDLNVGQKGVRYVVAAYVSYPSWPLVNEETVVTNRASSSGALVNFVMRLSLSGLVQPKRNSRMCSR